jgi:hypothetical protein
MVAAEASHGLEGRAPANPQLAGLLEQPFPNEVMAMALILVHIEAQE